MPSFRASLVLVALTCLMSLPSRAWAWGAIGHEIQSEAAIALMQSPLKNLFQPNTGALKRIVNVPDRNWKSGSSATDERPAHFFQWDFYQQSEISTGFPIPLQQALEALHASVLHKNGTALWRINQIHARLVAALRGKNWSEALQMASILGHYIGDLSQPMHTTSDYDGQSIDRRGIHKYFETTLLRRQNHSTLLAAILQRAGELDPATFRSESTPILDLSFEETKDAYGQLQPLLQIFEEDDSASEATRLLPMAIDALARGALTMAQAWDRASMDASIETAPGEKLTVANPNWVPFRIRDGQRAPMDWVANQAWRH